MTPLQTIDPQNLADVTGGKLQETIAKIKAGIGAARSIAGGIKQIASLVKPQGGNAQA